MRATNKQNDRQTYIQAAGNWKFPTLVSARCHGLVGLVRVFSFPLRLLRILLSTWIQNACCDFVINVQSHFLTAINLTTASFLWLLDCYIEVRISIGQQSTSMPSVRLFAIVNALRSKEPPFPQAGVRFLMSQWHSLHYGRKAKRFVALFRLDLQGDVCR